MKKTIQQIAREDGRYDPKALEFIYEGLGQTVANLKKDQLPETESRHITGQELAWGLGDLAQQRWGRLAKLVLNQWGLHTTRDFGEIVYLMIGHNWMSAQEEDRIEDFDDVFDFERVFEKEFRFEPQ
ncbi:Minf_1886 family protein [Anaerohalosphaera lusitana]|nr:Minf_1886 family protein [Anaerohalosphaera lusitana]